MALRITTARKLADVVAALKECQCRLVELSKLAAVDLKP